MRSGFVCFQGVKHLFLPFLYDFQVDFRNLMLRDVTILSEWKVSFERHCIMYVVESLQYATSVWLALPHDHCLVSLLFPDSCTVTGILVLT